MALTIAICDDNETHIKALRGLLDEWALDKPFAIDIDEYISAESFGFNRSNRPCDLLLLDIEMRELSGMELAKQLRSKGDTLPIIFITGYSEFMSDGYDVEALHYLLKPLDKSKLFPVLDRYILRRTPAQEIIINCEDDTIRICRDLIIYCEADGKNTIIHTKENTICAGTGISALCNSLGEDFIFCHRSFIVNLRYVRSIGKSEITLDTKETIPLSRRLYKQTADKFISYYKNKN